MKKIGKITLSRKYDVLSENEMKLVIGGSGSGSGTESNPDELNCEGKFYYTCYEAGNETTKTRVCTTSESEAEKGYCAMPGRRKDCQTIAVCKLDTVW